MIKFIKKIGLILLAFTLGAGCLFGCEIKKKEATISITAWYYYSGELERQFKKFVQDFNETVGKDKNIVIDAVGQGNIAMSIEMLKKAANNEPGAEKMPSMFMSYADTACAIDAIVPLANLDNYFTQQEIGEYVDGYIREGRIDSVNLKVFPIAKATETMILNITAWNEFAESYNEANPTTRVSLADFETDEGILSAAKKYNDTTGKALFCRDALDNYFFTGSMQLSQEIYTTDSRGKITINFDRTVAKALWDNYYIPMVKGYYSHEGSYGTACVGSKETLAAVGSTSASANYPDKIKLKVMKAPIAKAGAKNIYTQQGAGLSVVKSDERTQRACVEFLRWFSKDEQNIKFSVNTGYLPVKKAANDYEKIKSFANADVKKETLDTIKTALEMINDSERMYTCAPNVVSGKIREVFKVDFTTKCHTDDSIMKDIIKVKGKDSPEYIAALSQKTGDDNFDDWYAETIGKIGRAHV